MDSLVCAAKCWMSSTNLCLYYFAVVCWREQHQFQGCNRINELNRKVWTVTGNNTEMFESVRDKKSLIKLSIMNNTSRYLQCFKVNKDNVNKGTFSICNLNSPCNIYFIHTKTQTKLSFSSRNLCSCCERVKLQRRKMRWEHAICAPGNG